MTEIIITSRFNMDLKTLQALVAVHDECHFGRAAESISISQSTISEHIKRLEIRMGGTLFDRTSRKVSPNATCIELVKNIREPINDIRNQLAKTKDVIAGRSGSLNMGFMGGGLYEYHEAVENILKSHFPRLEFRFIEVHYDSQFSSILKGEIDIGICRMPVRVYGLSTGKPLFHDLRVVCLPKSHPLATRALICIEELADETMLQVNASYSGDEWANFHFPLATPTGKPFKRGMEIKTVREGMITTVMNGGVFLLTQRAASYYSMPNVVFVPVTMSPIITSLAYRTNDERPVIKQIMSLIESFFMKNT